MSAYSRFKKSVLAIAAKLPNQPQMFNFTVTIIKGYFGEFKNSTCDIFTVDDCANVRSNAPNVSKSDDDQPKSWLMPVFELFANLTDITIKHTESKHKSDTKKVAQEVNAVEINETTTTVINV